MPFIQANEVALIVYLPELNYLLFDVCFVNTSATGQACTVPPF
ncbi:hypothetical protein PLUTE_b0210 [Pseudoalteromonas luteoviolacea DSM 6061]|nr:hypothetical protein [Pseudoalteromonas luteoviolacea DSM 6061]